MIATKHSSYAQQAKAVNTLAFDSDKKIVGHNTDGIVY